MSLIIYTSRSEIPSDLRIIDNNDRYFDGRSIIPDSPLVAHILKDIDGATRASDLAFYGKFLENVALDRSMLCTGTKTLLNILQHPDRCFNVIECGDNALAYLSKITDGFILWEVCSMPWLEGNDNCDIIIPADGDKHYTSFNRVIDRLYYKYDRQGDIDDVDDC